MSQDTGVAANPVAEHVCDDDQRFRVLAEAAPYPIWRSRVDRRCDYFNNQWLEFTGRALADEIGLGWTRGLKPEDYQRCVETFHVSHAAPIPFTIDFHLLRHDGAYCWMLSTGVPYYEGGRFAGFLGSCVDISVHQRDHADSAAGRDLTLRELNHRLKNSLQTSICFSAYGRSLADQSTQDDLASMTERLSLLALSHEQLSRFTDGHGAGFCGYLEALVHAVHATVGNDNVALQVVCEPVVLSAKRASAVGAVVDELLTTALTQRFPAQRPGTVQVESRPLGGDRIELSISDDGVRQSPDHQRARASFQTQLVERMISHANGTIRYELDGGTRCVITLDPE